MGFSSKQLPFAACLRACVLMCVCAYMAVTGIMCMCVHINAGIRTVQLSVFHLNLSVRLPHLQQL